MVHIKGEIGKGLRDWLIQRITAVVLCLYFFGITIFFLSQSVSHLQWQALMNTFWMKVATLLTLMSLIAHVWLGLTTVMTDYLPAIRQRFLLQMVLFSILLIQFGFGLKIIWCSGKL